MNSIPVGSVPIICPKCHYREGWDIYEAVTDVGYPTERYYAKCRRCRHSIPLKPADYGRNTQ